LYGSGWPGVRLPSSELGELGELGEYEDEPPAPGVGVTPAAGLPPLFVDEEEAAPPFFPLSRKRAPTPIAIGMRGATMGRLLHAP
jgi:hypothetical protein